MVETRKPYGFIATAYVKDIIQIKDKYYIVERSGHKIETTKEEYEKWNSTKSI